MLVHVEPSVDTWIWKALAYATSQVNLHPLRVAELAGPPGAGVAVECRPCGRTGVLDRGRGGRPALRRVGGAAARCSAADGAVYLERWPRRSAAPTTRRTGPSCWRGWSSTGTRGA